MGLIQSAQLNAHCPYAYLKDGNEAPANRKGDLTKIVKM